MTVREITKQNGDGNKVCGVYCIYNSKYFYIGLSKNVRKRWKQHQSHLRRNNHHNVFMQRVYNKYKDIDPFCYEIVLECEFEDLSILEKKVFEEYSIKFPNKIALNIAECGSSWTEESIKKAIKSHKGKNLDKETRRKISEGQTGIVRESQRIPIVQLSLQGEFIKLWDSRTTVEKELGIHVQLNRKTSGGFQWQKLEDYEKHPKGAVSYEKTQSVTQYTLNGIFIRSYDSITEASRITGIRHCNISNALHGIQNSAGGFIWK